MICVMYLNDFYLICNIIFEELVAGEQEDLLDYQDMIYIFWHISCMRTLY